MALKIMEFVLKVAEHVYATQWQKLWGNHLLIILGKDFGSFWNSGRGAQGEPLTRSASMVSETPNFTFKICYSIVFFAYFNLTTIFFDSELIFRVSLGPIKTALSLPSFLANRKT